jgi:AcrR family transcriptional regulator
MELYEKILSPKKREIQERPGLILRVARQLMNEDGYADLTIENIAKVMNCSRPPIYEHFSSREDVVMGIAIEDA